MDRHDRASTGLRSSQARNENLLSVVSLIRRIAFRCEAGFSSTDFSLCAFPFVQKSKPHRLKPALLDRAGVVWTPCRDFAGECDGCQNGRSIKGSLVILVPVEKNSSNRGADNPRRSPGSK